MRCEPDAAPIAFVVAHHVPGRLRLKLLPGRGNAPLTEACLRLMRIPATISATPNPLTGSIVLRYDRLEMPGETIFDAVRHSGLPLALAAACRASEGAATRFLADAVANRVCEWVVESLALAAIAAAT
ncbi:MAG TPA: hypothetical protein VF007_02535 [Stellaceae bacterium]